MSYLGELKTITEENEVNKCKLEKLEAELENIRYSTLCIYVIGRVQKLN